MAETRADGVRAACLTAVVGHPDRLLTERAAATLRTAGYGTTTVYDVGRLATGLATGTPDVVLVSPDLVQALARLPGRESGDRPASATGDVPEEAQTNQRSEGGPVPALLLVDFASTAGWEVPAAHAAFGPVDCIGLPLRAEELVSRTNALVKRAARQQATSTAVDFLRARMRRVSDAIRATNDVHVMGSELVAGVTAALGADWACFRTFTDDRVPAVQAQWSNKGDQALEQVTALDTAAAQALADQLWRQATVLAVSGHAAGPGPFASVDDAAAGHFASVDDAAAGHVAAADHAAVGHADPADRLAALGCARPGSSVLVPVGEGETAFGVLWVGYSAAPREWSRAELSLLQHVAGNVGYALMQGALIGTQQQVLQRLQQLDQAKADFLATVNHELRTPLTSITAYLDMIRDGEAGDVPLGVAQMLEVVHRNAGRLRSMIEDMLTVSRQAEPVPDLQLAPVDVTELLRTVTATLRPSAATRRVRLTVSGPAREAVVRANAPQLEQVFLNIVTNAVKFTPDGGQVRVVAAPDAVPGNAGGVRVEVRDTGIGIPEDELADLFTRFFRASNATATAVPGSGLGLSIAKDIVASHRGSIDVGSVLGQGTAVTVRLPADPAAAAVSGAGQDGTGDRVGPAFIRGADEPPRRP